MCGHLSGSTSSATRRHGCVRRRGDCEFGANEKGCIVDFETVNIGRRPKLIAAISARQPFWVPLCCRIKCLCCSYKWFPPRASPIRSMTQIAPATAYGIGKEISPDLQAVQLYGALTDGPMRCMWVIACDRVITPTWCARTCAHLASINAGDRDHSCMLDLSPHM